MSFLKVFVAIVLALLLTPIFAGLACGGCLAALGHRDAGEEQAQVDQTDPRPDSAFKSVVNPSESQRH